MAVSAPQKADKSVSFGYYSAAWKQRKLTPETQEAIKKASEESKAPEKFVQTLIGASKGNYFAPELEEDFVFSPKEIVDILKAYKPEKQEVFDYLSKQEGDMFDEERFTGSQMRDMYIASSKASLDTIKQLVNARNDNGYQKYSGTEIAKKLQGE
jgi:hypothetical protein